MSQFFIIMLSVAGPLFVAFLSVDNAAEVANVNDPLQFFFSSTSFDPLCRVHRDCRHDRRHLQTLRHRLQHPGVNIFKNFSSSSVIHP